MLFLLNTPNFAGVSICGDYLDLDALQTALFEVIGEPGQYSAYTSARSQIQTLCHTIRHALMGEREVEFVDNGMDQGKMRRLASITPTKNVYYSVRIIWPEVLFICVALNDFIQFHLGRRGKYPARVENHTVWDNTVVQCRMFQSAVVQCLHDLISESALSRIRKLLCRGSRDSGVYITQYVELLAIKFLSMSKERRVKYIPVIVKRLTEQSHDYGELRDQVVAAAQEYNCPVNEIRLHIQRPEVIEW